MLKSLGTYDSDLAKSATLDKVISLFSSLGVKNLFVKSLAPNDNSKNQPYLGSHLTDLHFIPTGKVTASETTSTKSTVKGNDKRKIKYQASVKMSWITLENEVYPAPEAKLIYYPQYPEVRFSGFLKGSNVKMSQWMDPNKDGRAKGRWLILGTGDHQTLYAYLVTPHSQLSTELANTNLIDISNVFKVISHFNDKKSISSKDRLIEKLLDIHHLGWISGQKLNALGVKEPYSAPNAGGYTLEAELGVAPNGIAEPDFLGWEVKQFGVKSFPAKGTKPTTLMTPEPNGGIYVDQGAKEFVRQYGYPDKSGKPNRLNFGGKHMANQICQGTNLTMQIIGFSQESYSITDAEGKIALVDKSDKIAASWSFAKLMDHWKTKHSQTVFIPCVSQISPGGVKQYHYGKDIELGMGTSFELLLKAISNTYVYYDPGIKLENISSNKPKIKKRSQFRVSHKALDQLYKTYEFIDIANYD